MEPPPASSRPQDFRPQKQSREQWGKWGDWWTHPKAIVWLARKRAERAAAAAAASEKSAASESAVAEKSAAP